MNEIALYEPHANQIKIHESEAKYRVVVAGRRFGKSALALNEALARAFLKKNQVIWIILPLQKQAKEIYWIDPDITKYFFPYVQMGQIKIDNSELSLRVNSTNSWIRLKGSDNYESLRGSGLDLIIWDEVADVKEKAFDVIEPSLADSPYHRMLYIGTPKGLNWFHDFALQGDHEGVIPSFGKPITPLEDWQTWHFTSYDNKAWPDGSVERTKFVEFINQKKIEAERKGKLTFFEQEYMASFQEGAGRFFPKWNHQSHVIPPFMPRKENIIVGGMDWGRVAPFAFLLTEISKVKYDGVNFHRAKTFMEVYGTNKTPKEWADVIKKDLKFYNLTLDDITWIQGDPSMFTKQNDNTVSIADQFLKEGIRIKPASNDRIGGWENLQNWLTDALDGKPYWQVTNNCSNLIRTIPEQVPDKNKIEDLDTEKEDHALDAERYKFKALKWLDSKSGGVKQVGNTEKVVKTAQFIGPKQVSMNLDKWQNPNKLPDTGVGGIKH